jgi:hypothetical protein
MEVKFTVPIYWKQTKKKTVLVGLNWYRNCHFMALNKAKKDYYGYILSNDCKVRLNPPISISFAIYLKRKGSDGGNVRSVIEKFVLDAFVRCKIIPDDTFDIVISDSSEYYLDRKNPRAEITVREL